MYATQTLEITIYAIIAYSVWQNIDILLYYLLQLNKEYDSISNLIRNFYAYKY